MIMALISCNVIMRLLGYPIKGAVEFVGFLSSIAIGLSLAYCATQGGHIAVTLFTDKLSEKVQKWIELLVDIVVLFFLSLVVFRLCIYAITLRVTGQISLTTGIPYYPFVIVVAFGFLVYCLVVLSSVLTFFKKGVRE